MEFELETVVAECHKGNLDRFGLLFDAYYKKIYQFIYFRTLHKETAEDITSLVFTKVLENFSDYDKAKAGFSTWLFQIAKNSLIDHYRTKKEVLNIEDVWDMPDGTNIESEFDSKEKLAMVKSYLKSLPARQRDIVIMRVWDGLSHKEIASILEISEANSKMIFSRVMSQLSQDMPQVLIYMLILQNLWNN